MLNDNTSTNISKGQIQQQFEILEKEVESIIALMGKIEDKFIPITTSPPPKQENDSCDKPPLVLLADRLNKITNNLREIEERMNGLLTRCEL